MAALSEDAAATMPSQQQDSKAPVAEPAAVPSTDATSSKPIHSLVVDTGPIIKNDPPVSTLLAQAEELYTIPSVISEIRDEATRARVETTLLPFLKLRNPKPESIKFINDFARRTGDLEVLSRPDIHLLALTYELECERNGGDWRLRKTPAQKGVNGKSPAALAAEEAKGEDAEEKEKVAEPVPAAEPEEVPSAVQEVDLEDKVEALSLGETAAPADPKDEQEVEEEEEEEDEADDDDGGEWITPSNLKKHKAKEQGRAPEQAIQKRLQAALLTSDFAMQNVALRVNLNLLSPGMARITQVKTWVLRCHGCFAVTRQMEKQFCPACGQSTLTRVSCSTDASGQFRLHLKRNFQFNKRGNVYSVPKPVHGSASGKHTDRSGGGHNGWGRELILSEDQPEYTKKLDAQQRTRVRDMMDEDYLPGLLTGVRNSAGGRIRVGAGRGVNARRRK